MMLHKKKYSISNCSSIQYIENSQNGIIIEENSNCPNNSKHVAKHNPFLGFFYSLVSSVFFAFTSVIVKKVTYMSPGYLSLIRNAFVFTGCLPIAICSVKDVFGERKDRKKLLARGILGGTSLYLNLTTFRYLPLTEAAIVLSTTPALTSLLAFLYLKEACGLVQVSSVILTMAGMLLSVRLPELLSDSGGDSSRFDYYYLEGLASGVGCVLFLSVTLVTLRKMKDMHFSVPVLYFGFFGVVENALINSVTSTFEYPHCGWDPLLIILLGVFSFVAQCALGIAVQKEAVGLVAVMRSSLDIIVAMLLQIAFFDEKLDVYNISGACLVITSVSAIGLRNWLRTLPEESDARKRLKFLLL